LLRRPQVSFDDLVRMIGGQDAEWLTALPDEVIEQVEVRAQYDGYIQRQMAEISRRRATEDTTIPPDLPIKDLVGITVEAKDKLLRIRPMTLGQASRIAGVSPADISVLMMYIHRHGSSSDERTGHNGPAGADVETSALAD
jgi:tRNA uridine 5-carboxymethylaminomethyl modification enzyme